VIEEHSTIAEPEAPLNLTVRRTARPSSRRAPSRQSLSLPRLGWIIPAALLLSALGRRKRFSIPAAAVLAAGALGAVVAAALTNRQRSAREAAIDERIEQSFPASDPASV
jgi:hypothetical protein